MSENRSGGREKKQAGRIFKTPLEVAEGNDRIARRLRGARRVLTPLEQGAPPGALVVRE